MTKVIPLREPAAAVVVDDTEQENKIEPDFLANLRGDRNSQICEASHICEFRPALIWQSASEAATAELATLRAEARHAARTPR